MFISPCQKIDVHYKALLREGITLAFLERKQHIFFNVTTPSLLTK